MTPLYEDNHIIIVNKAAGEIVQGDKTGDTPLSDLVKAYLKEKYAKPGEVFLGVVHRLDRPVSGVVVFAKTSKALSRLNEMFRKGEVHKTYHAIIPKLPFLTKSSTPTLLTHYLTRNEKQNKAYAHTKEIQGSKKATLDFQLLQSSDRYALLQVNLHTGRHHQIRCQLATALAPIKGDLKYGSPRSNPDGSICLHARNVSFIHPVSKQEIIVLAPYPTLPIWDVFNQ
jgi:23S rRNA pseudouridine1911/1915/1917 synthase